MAFVPLTYLCISSILVSSKAQLSSPNSTSSWFGQENYAPELFSLTTNCLSGWYSFGGKCFRSGGWIRSEELSWEKAVTECSEYGAQLASIHSKEEQDFLMAFLLLNADAPLWIGLHDRVNESIYEWEDGSPFEFENWHELEPSGLKDEKEDCVEMRYEISSGMGKWNDIDCVIHKAYICQMPPDATHSAWNPVHCVPSAGGGYSLKDSCYHIVNISMPWDEAEAYCSSVYGGNLISVMSFLEQTFLSYLLEQLGTSSAFWIGIKFKEGQPVRWSSGWHLAFSQWAMNVKEDELGDGSCVVRTKSGHWDTQPCEKSFPFVCEVSAVEAPTLQPSKEGSSCPGEFKKWRDLGGEMCYFFDTENMVSWYEGHLQCMRKGGALVSIHSADELKIMEQFAMYTQPVLHIGLYRNQDDDFVWADGSELDFHNWDIDEPNNKKELCVEMITRTMSWNDVSCENRRGYICSIKKVSPNITAEGGKEHCSSGLSVAMVVGVGFCILFVVVFLGACVYFCRPWDGEPSRLRKISRDLLHGHQHTRPTEIVIREDYDYYYQNVN